MITITTDIGPPWPEDDHEKSNKTIEKREYHEHELVIPHDIPSGE